MTIEETYKRLRYSIAELQYYLDKINQNLETITIIAAVAIVIALSAMLFLFYSFYIIKKQEKELKKTTDLLQALIETSTADEETNNTAEAINSEEKI